MYIFLNDWLLKDTKYNNTTAVVKKKVKFNYYTAIPYYKHFCPGYSIIVIKCIILIKIRSFNVLLMIEKILWNEI